MEMNPEGCVPELQSVQPAPTFQILKKEKTFVKAPSTPLHDPVLVPLVLKAAKVKDVATIFTGGN